MISNFDFTYENVLYVVCMVLGVSVPLTPVVSAFAMVRENSTLGAEMLPLSMMALDAMIGLGFAVAREDTTIQITRTVGFLCATISICSYVAVSGSRSGKRSDSVPSWVPLWLADDSKRGSAVRTALIAPVVATVIAIVDELVVWENLFSVATVVMSILFTASPLIAVYKVWQGSGDINAIPLLLASVNLFSCIAWALRSISEDDYATLASTAIGAVACILQVGTYLIFRGRGQTTTASEDKEDNDIA